MALLQWRKKTLETSREEASFGDLALPLLDSIYNVARWLTRDAGDAEDLVQETLLKALRGFASFELGTNFKAWIFRILRNTYLTSRSGLEAMRTVALEDELNARSDATQQYPEGAVERRTPEVELIRMRDGDSLRAAMEKLPPHLLEAILLSDVEEMKYREIAGVLGIPMGTVMSRIARGRSFLRRELEAASAASREVRK
jgi:RNA polymerase sigma-70 factor (ECF subfamily)